MARKNRTRKGWREREYAEAAPPCWNCAEPYLKPEAPEAPDRQRVKNKDTSGRPILTIISPAISSRRLSGRIFAELQEQVDCSPYHVEILVLMDNCLMPIGDKVCKLNHMASGDYIIAVGDDDDPRPNYVEEICKAIVENPGVDVVTFKLDYHQNGKFLSTFTYGLGLPAISPGDPARRPATDCPHQRCAIRREIVQSYFYPEGIWYPEDYIFRDFMRDNDMLKTAAHIDKVLYDVRFEREKRYDCGWKRKQQACYNDSQENEDE